MISILHISRTMGQGGAEKVVYQLCKDNKDIIQMVASTGGIYADELCRSGIRHYKIFDIDRKNPVEIFRNLKRLNDIVKSKKINLIHSHHRMAAFYARMLQICNHDLKHVYTAHNVFYGKKSFMRFAVNKAVVIACGETVKKNLIEEYSIPAGNIKVICNSIELMPIKDISIDILSEKEKNGAYLIGSVGRITEQKGFDVFIKAIALSKKKAPNIVGVIIGDGEERQKTALLAKKEGVEDSIVFLGYQKEVPSIIAKMEFMILASRWEGFPLTPIETFSVGKTIIVSDIENNLEIVKHGINGLKFQKDDAEDLSRMINKLYLNDELKRKLERNAFDSYKHNYNYELFLSCYREMWERAVTDVSRKA